jgi:hypothetical protein
MTRLFKRKNNKTTIAELEEYYANQNQKKARPFRTWVMALFSIFVAIALIIALFLAGRWLYDTVFNDSAEAPTTSDTNGANDIDLPTFDGNIVGQGNSSTDNTSTEGNTSNTGGGSDVASDNTSDSSEGVVSDQAASTSESNIDRVVTTGASEDEIPNTGAGEILIIAPIIAAIAGYTVSRRKQINNS